MYVCMYVCMYIYIYIYVYIYIHTHRRPGESSWTGVPDNADAAKRLEVGGNTYREPHIVHPAVHVLLVRRAHKHVKTKEWSITCPWKCSSLLDFLGFPTGFFRPDLWGFRAHGGPTNVCTLQRCSGHVW